MDPSSNWSMVPCLETRKEVVTQSSNPSQDTHRFSDTLPDHLLIEILCRLPNCKYVVQCKSVCKHWGDLVSDPYFVKHFVTHTMRCGFVHIDTVSSSCSNINFDESHPKSDFKEQQLLCVVMQHLTHRPQDGLLMHLTHPLSNPKRFSFRSLGYFGQGEGGDAMPINVVGAFNDLLLCHKESSDGQKHELFLCNVQTRQWHVLPSPPLVSNMNHFGFLCEPHYYFEKGNNNSHVVPNALYRYIIAIIPHKCRIRMSFTKFNVLIYSSETNQWRESLLSLPKPTRLEIANTCGFGLNGMIHIRSVNYIFGFDPYNKGDVIQCHPIKWPSDQGITLASFAAFQGCLYASRISDDGRLDIWLLQDYKMGIWSLQHSLLVEDLIPRPAFLARYLKNRKSSWVMGFHPTCPHLLYLFCGGRIALCDVTKRSVETASRIPSDFRKSFFLWNTCIWVTLPLWPTPLPTSVE